MIKQASNSFFYTLLCLSWFVLFFFEKKDNITASGNQTIIVHRIMFSIMFSGYDALYPALRESQHDSETIRRCVI